MAGMASRVKTEDKVLVVKADDNQWYIVAVIPEIRAGQINNPRSDKDTAAEEYFFVNRTTGAAVGTYANGVAALESSDQAFFWSIPGVDALHGVCRRMQIKSASGDWLLLQDDKTGDVAMRIEGKAHTKDEAESCVIQIGKHEDSDAVASIAIFPNKKSSQEKLHDLTQEDLPWASKWDGVDRVDWNTRIKFYKDGRMYFESGVPTTDGEETKPNITAEITPEGKVNLTTVEAVNFDVLRLLITAAEEVKIMCKNFVTEADVKAIIRSVAVEIGKEALEPIVKKTFYDYFTNKFLPAFNHHQHGGIQYGSGFSQQPTKKAPTPDTAKSLTKNTKAG